MSDNGGPVTIAYFYRTNVGRSRRVRRACSTATTGRSCATSWRPGDTST